VMRPGAEAVIVNAIRYDVEIVTRGCSVSRRTVLRWEARE
jgi:hypothetical protein